MRIIGGALGGRHIKAPRGRGTRPTSERVREALFSILGAPADDCQVLDVCAGSGGLGIEALSRGAASAGFVEHAAPALRCLRSNLASLGLSASSQIHARDARTVLRTLEGQFSWIFVDPPYSGPLAGQVLEILGSGELLAPGGIVIVEHDRRHEPVFSCGCLVRTDSRQYGDTVVTFYRTDE